jgi:REP element-mobilizing transposase RayT
MLERVKNRKPFRIFTYCLMPNHFHLLLEAGETPVAVVLQRLLTGYTQYFNRTYKHKGHLLQGRYKSIICDKDSYLLELNRYIHLNPVRAGLVKTPAGWKWSGYGEYIDKRQKRLVTVEPVLSQFGKNATGAVKRYVAFVNDGVGINSKSEYYPGESSPYIGGDGFVEDMTLRHLERMTERTTHRKQKDEMLEDILAAICRKNKMKEEMIRGSSRSRPVAKARKEFAQVAFDAGHPAASIARFINRSNCYISKIIEDRFI